MTAQEPIATGVPAGAADWRVAFMVHHFPRVSETFVATLAASLIPHVRDLDILATDGEVAPRPHHSIVDRAGLLEHLHISPRDGRVPLRRFRALARETPDKRARLLAMGLAAQMLPPERTALFRMLAQRPAYDVVHCHFGYVGLVAQRHRQFGTLRTRALVSHFRGSDITRFVREKGDEVYEDLFRQAEGFLANCDFFRQRAIALGCPPERIDVVGSPIDTDRFIPPPRPRALPVDRPVRLIAVGRLVEKKGFGDAIAALAGMRRDATLDILGDGPLRPALERQASAMGVAGRITFHGAATADQVLAALHRADIGLAPSVVAADGDADAPVNTLKEMMATGLPVAATCHGGIPELVIPEENGALAPERAPEALAAAIDGLADHPDRWDALGRAGRAKVIAEYGLDRITAKTLEVYEKALDHSRRRSA